MSPEMKLALVRALLAGSAEKVVDPEDGAPMDAVIELQNEIAQAIRIIDAK